MKAQQRRKEIAALLLASDMPITGAALSEKLGASRQIIVRDIAILKEEGYDIISTHTGYMIKESPLPEIVLKLRHTSEQTCDELTCIVDLGGTVVDVFVNHKVYGRIEAKLNIFSRESVKEFIDGIKSGKSVELMNLTSGYHYHTIRAQSQHILDKIEQALEQKGYLVR
ncbi:MAG: transcription repressor NadR [Oscillospiraceae bacterium]|nr:transcription repressor NadR [Oscillospiraceae bacterium]